MINKLTVQSIINKYYLGTNESVKWEVKDNFLNVDFMTPSKDVIGNVTCTNFQLEDCKLAIYDTKKLNSLKKLKKKKNKKVKKRNVESSIEINFKNFE